jgi:hypothetical protein
MNIPHHVYCSLTMEVSYYLWQADVLADSNPARAKQSTADFRTFVSEKQGYRLELPASWQDKSKAGADALFEDPLRPSTNVGITVAPVRVSNIAQFGDLNTVSSRLLAAEQKKVSAPFPLHVVNALQFRMLLGFGTTAACTAHFSIPWT